MSSSVSRPYSTVLSNSTLLPLLLLSLARQKHSPKIATQIKAEYDYVIVGAGSAGSVVANRLSEVSCVSVLLLEAGPPPPLLTEVPALFRESSYTNIDWDYRTTPQKHTGLGLINRQVVFPRGKTLGGSSIMNGMFYVRGNKHNFDEWAAQGATGWRYEEVLPYFKKLEDNRNPETAANGYHGVGGPLTIELMRYMPEPKIQLFRSAMQLGYRNVDINAETQTGYNDPQLTIRDAQRCSTAKAYLVPAENRTNLDIVPNAMVLKVIIQNKRAIGVLVDFKGVTHEIRAKKEVILSAGAINTPQLLMLSGIGPREELEKHNIKVEVDLPVGLNLHDHAQPSIEYLLDSSYPNFLQKLLDPKNLAQYIHSRSGPLASNAFWMQAFLSINPIPRIDFPDYQLLFGETTAAGIAYYFGLTPEVYRQVYERYENKSMMSCFPYLMQPRSRGRLTLKSADPYDHPLIDPNYFADPYDVDVAVESLKACNRIALSNCMRAVGLRALSSLYPGCERYAGNEELYFRCQIKTSVATVYHPVGTAKMGDPRDRSTVVDPTLRVKYIKGLRVVDASVIPIITSGNLNAPVIMIGEKASDIIKETINCEDHKNEDYFHVYDDDEQKHQIYRD